MQLYDGIGFVAQRPMTMGLLIIAVILILLPSIRAKLASVRARGVADGD
jgi:putative tricarboxylic transport membrane protein